jgi:hypothetical protein
MTIKEKENFMTQIIKEKLDNLNYEITMIFTNYDSNGLLRNGGNKTLLTTTFVEPIMDKSIHVHVHTDFETLEMLYVQTGPMNFVDIEEFFQSE